MIPGATCGCALALPSAALVVPRCWGRWKLQSTSGGALSNQRASPHPCIVELGPCVVPRSQGAAAPNTLSQRHAPAPEPRPSDAPMTARPPAWRTPIEPPGPSRSGMRRQQGTGSRAGAGAVRAIPGKQARTRIHSRACRDLPPGDMAIHQGRRIGPPLAPFCRAHAPCAGSRGQGGIRGSGGGRAAPGARAAVKSGRQGASRPSGNTRICQRGGHARSPRTPEATRTSR